MDRRRVYDLTLTVREGMPSWPGDPPVRLERVRSMERGDRLNLTRLDLSAHTGTHVDAPSHFMDGGVGVDSLPTDTLVGPCLVVDVPGARDIGEEELRGAGIPPGTERLLLRTDNAALLSRQAFEPSYAHLTPDGARHLVDLGLRLVGIDYLSIAPYGHGEEVHRILLTSGVVIVEGLDLRGAPAGPGWLTALPMKIADADGAPARVLLFA